MIKRVILGIATTFTIILLAISVIAFVSAVIIDQDHTEFLEKPVNNAIDSIIYRPGESRINKDKIQVYENAIVIEVYDAQVNNKDIRDPLVNKDSNMIQIIPDLPQSIKEGDIITYEKEDRIKTNRVEIVGQDQKGYYYLISEEQDKVRFIDIKSIIIGILY